MQVALAFLLSLLAAASAAPLLEEQEPPRPHRESTKAILDLEQQLKEQAGEDKQYFPSQMQPVIPALTQADLMSSGEEEEDEEAELAKAMKPIVVDALADSNEDPDDMNHIKRQDGPPAPPAVGKEESNSEEDSDTEETEGEDKDTSEEVIPKQESHDEEEPVGESEIQSHEEESDESQMSEEDIFGQGFPKYDENEEAYEEYEEKLFLQTVMDTLKEHPEMVEELLGEDRNEGETEEELMRMAEYADQMQPGPLYDNEVPEEIDNQDRDAEIRAEVMQAVADSMKNKNMVQGPPALTPEEEAQIMAAQTGVPARVDADEDELQRIASDPRLYQEKFQTYQGDSSARVVSKKRGYAPPEYSQESSEEQSNEKQDQQLAFNPENYSLEELQELKAYMDHLASMELSEEEDKANANDISSVAM